MAGNRDIKQLRGRPSRGAWHISNIFIHLRKSKQYGDRSLHGVHKRKLKRRVGRPTERAVETPHIRSRSVNAQRTAQTSAENPPQNPADPYAPWGTRLIPQNAPASLISQLLLGHEIASPGRLRSFIIGESPKLHDRATLFPYPPEARIPANSPALLAPRPESPAASAR